MDGMFCGIGSLCSPDRALRRKRVSESVFSGSNPGFKPAQACASWSWRFSAVVVARRGRQAFEYFRSSCSRTGTEGAIQMRRTKSGGRAKPSKFGCCARRYSARFEHRLICSAIPACFCARAPRRHAGPLRQHLLFVQEIFSGAFFSLG